MTHDQWLIVAILALTVGMFLWGRWRHDMVAVASLLACVAAGLVPSAQAFAGFGHPAVITVACVLVLSQGLQHTGAVDALSRAVLPTSAGPVFSIAALSGLGAFLSAFMNNVGALALLMPLAIQLAGKHNWPPGRVLMPLAFGTILGGMATMIGTPPNLIVAGFRAEAGLGSFAMFDFSPVGLAVSVAGLLFIALVGWRLVPARKTAGASGFDVGVYFTEVRVTSASKAAHQSLREVDQLLVEADAQIVGLVRNDLRLLAPNSQRKVKPGDILIIEAEPESLALVLSTLGLRLEEAVPVANGSDDKGELPSDVAASANTDALPAASHSTTLEVGSAEYEVGVANVAEKHVGHGEAGAVSADKLSPVTDRTLHAEQGVDAAGDDEAAHSGEVVLQEVVVMTGARAIGRSATDLQLRTRYGLNLLAISRQGNRSIKRLRVTVIAPGDVLLLQGPPDALTGFASEFGCVPLAARAIRIPDKRRAVVATAVMLAGVGGAAFGLLPAAISFALAVLVYMALRVVPMRKVYESVDWPVIVLLGCLMPVAGAMASTGAGDVLARALLDGVAQGNPVVALTLILVVTMTLSDFMNNAATAAVMCPIAISAAAQLGVSPDAFLMAVAVGASCAFLTPIGHQNNTLILGPGGFRFGDYWRLGLPLELLVVLVGVPALLWAWPL